MLDVDLTAEIPQTAHEAADGRGLIAAGEVIGAKIAVRHGGAEDVVARAEHGGRDGEDRFLGAAAGFEAEELGLEIAVLRADGGPSRRDEGGLDPGGTERARVERRLPALSSLRGQRPAHEIRWRRWGSDSCRCRSRR